MQVFVSRPKAIYLTSDPVGAGNVDYIAAGTTALMNNESFCAAGINHILLRKTIY